MPARLLFGLSLLAAILPTRNLAAQSMPLRSVSVAGVKLKSEDIGKFSSPGHALADASGDLNVTADGGDIWDEADSFHFTYGERTGDFDVCARIVSFGPQGVHRTAKAALMLRESTSPESRHITITTYPTLRVWMAYQRAVTAGPTVVLGESFASRSRPRPSWPNGAAFPNIWVRLKRVGNTITTYGSADGVEWQQVNDSCVPKLPFPDKVLVGLATSSHGHVGTNLPPSEVRYADFGDYVITNAVITFVQHPASIATFENRSVTFSASAKVTGTSASNISYQWQRNGISIPGATKSIYTSPLVISVDHGNRYRVRASLPGGYAVFSEEAILAVRADETPPAVHSVAALPGGPIAIRFNELMRLDCVGSANNYRIDGTAVGRARLLDDGYTVLLPEIGPGDALHQLCVSNVADLAGNLAHAVIPVSRLDWKLERIGVSPEVGLAYAPNAAEINVQAAPGNIWTNSDSFLFVQRARTGDFDVSVQMASLNQASDYTRGGLMVRENLAAESRNFYICTYSAIGENRWVTTTRLESGNPTSLAPGNSYMPRARDFAYPNVWFRLKRVGNTFTAFYGTNGVEWRQLGNQFTPSPPYPPTVHLGVATTPNATHLSQPVQAQYLNFADWVVPTKLDLNVGTAGKTSANSNPSTAKFQ